MTFLRVFLIAWCLGAAVGPAIGQVPIRCPDELRTLPQISLASCAKTTWQQAALPSVKGRKIWRNDVLDPDAVLRVLVVGAIHGDETSSGSVAMQWMGLATQSPANPNPAIHWRFIPVLNPDGLLNKPPRRVNANGVDLNRNFPTHNWERDSVTYWTQRTKKDPRRYPGKKPLSEPESRMLHDEIKRFAPHLIVSIHAPYGVLDFDGPIMPPSKLGRLYLDQVGIFPGSLGNFAGVKLGIPVVTVELPQSFRPPQAVEVRQMWLDLMRWITERLMPARAQSVP
jgi:murein peptide amidase A